METKLSLKKKTPHVGGVLGKAPVLMSELTTEFIRVTNLNDRAKIRARMKAVLDFISVDTSYPDVSDGSPPARGFDWEQGGALAVGRNPGYDAPIPQVLPIPGADNTI